MLADDVAEEGISHCVYIRTSQRHQHDHLTKTVHDRQNGVVAAVFRQVRDEVDVDLLPQGLRNWQWLVQASQLTCVSLVALTNIAALTVPAYGIPHTWPVIPFSNHCVSVVHPQMATRIMELVQHHRYQSFGYKQTSLVGQKLPQAIFQYRKIGTLATSQAPLPPQHWVACLSVPKLLEEAWQ